MIKKNLQFLAIQYHGTVFNIFFFVEVLDFFMLGIFHEEFKDKLKFKKFLYFFKNQFLEKCCRNL